MIRRSSLLAAVVVLASSLLGGIPTPGGSNLCVEAHTTSGGSQNSLINSCPSGLQGWIKQCFWADPTVNGTGAGGNVCVPMPV